MLVLKLVSRMYGWMHVQRRFSYAAGGYVRAQQYKFYAYASNVDGEGPPSAPVTFTAPSR